MKRASYAANCDASKKRWPIRIWNWCWSRRSWQWPVSNWTRAWRSLKKSTLAGGAPGGRGRPGVEGDRGVRTGGHDSAKLLRAALRLAPAGSRCGIGAGVGAGGTNPSAALGGEKTLSPDRRGVEGGWSEDGPGSAL